MPGNGVGSVRIPKAALKEMIEKALGAEFPSDASIRFGNPSVSDEDELVIDYAFDTDDCDPTEWADGQPDWLKAKYQSQS
jgi:hypothetical protein